MKLSIQEAKDFFNEYGGELCEFKGGYTNSLKAVRHSSLLPYLCNNDNWWSECRPYTKPEPKLWTCETAHRNLRVRGKGWTKGTYIHAHVFKDAVWLVGGEGVEIITWKELAEDWEQFDGSPCYEVGE
jgi:hypothetical protein